MNLEDVKRISTPRKRQKRVGRGPGSGRGKTAGRGTKGQKARTGVKPPIFEGNTMPFYRRIPKRGFNNARFEQRYVILNVESLNQFSEGQVVTPEILYAAHLISKREKKLPYLKILGKGELKVRSLVVKAHQFSAAAEEKIKAAGGQIERFEKQAPQETKTSTSS